MVTEVTECDISFIFERRKGGQFCSMTLSCRISWAAGFMPLHMGLGLKMK